MEALNNTSAAAQKRENYQPESNDDSLVAKDPNYLSEQLITYIGNKRALLGQIGKAIMCVKKRTGKQYLRVFDAFSGSGVVSRFLKAHASFIVSNDFEDYAAVIARCYLRNRSSVNFTALSEIVDELNARVTDEPLPKGFIETLYAPKDESEITKDDRVFYTPTNARRLDNYRRMINGTPSDFRDLLLGPLLSAASVHSNTAGVFKGFYKDRTTGVGQYGGTGLDALKRIKGKIQLEIPVLSKYECDYQVLQDDTNKVASQIEGLDLAYIDPPYNQHPYGSNYFMLNLLVHYKRPDKVSRVSGIPSDWRRSGYNVRTKSLLLLKELLHKIDARFLLISFNNEGFISPDEMRAMLQKIGVVDEFNVRYNTFRGSRNLRNRTIHVTEQMFLVERR
ncbi:DNA modification methylase [Candidatus Poribacteria bacterium]|nr:DNA modification methylase [Candidatus Poribacteria bacterium]